MHRLPQFVPATSTVCTRVRAASRSTSLTLGVLVLGMLAGASTLEAQQKQSAAKPPAAAAPASVQALVGTWMGIGTVQLGDSTIKVPVSYTFTQGASGIAGTAMVPGQGSGVISNVTRNGSRVQFRVTVTPAAVQRATQGATTPAEPTILEHDGTIGADGALDGMVNLKGQPLAKFRISPKK